ncbi:YbaN family protein [uncultured Alistipes sp.]|uniref:YbaN family protein n=1 Tax=uncultured Alistipes sp. TaxID=538949 RepID=UPI0025D5118A|nr:YbaN family protein [uncultured Alistipes sp.]
MKFCLAALGCISFVMGIIGIFVPLLPTTPFLLLAAALWVRSSPRLYDWLLAHPRLGEYIRNFRENRAIPLRAKVVSLTLMWGAMLYCIFGLLGQWWWAQAALLLVAVGVSWHILSFATLKKQNRP